MIICIVLHINTSLLTLKDQNERGVTLCLCVNLTQSAVAYESTCFCEQVRCCTPQF